MHIFLGIYFITGDQVKVLLLILRHIGGSRLLLILPVQLIIFLLRFFLLQLLLIAFQHRLHRGVLLRLRRLQQRRLHFPLVIGAVFSLKLIQCLTGPLRLLLQFGKLILRFGFLLEGIGFLLERFRFLLQLFGFLLSLFGFRLFLGTKFLQIRLLIRSQHFVFCFIVVFFFDIRSPALQAPVQPFGHELNANPIKIRTAGIHQGGQHRIGIGSANPHIVFLAQVQLFSILLYLAKMSGAAKITHIEFSVRSEATNLLHCRFTIFLKWVLRTREHILQDIAAIDRHRQP